MGPGLAWGCHFGANVPAISPRPLLLSSPHEWFPPAKPGKLTGLGRSIDGGLPFHDRQRFTGADMIRISMTAIGLLVLLTGPAFAFDEPNKTATTFIDPAKAGPDFIVQGEYEG